MGLDQNSTEDFLKHLKFLITPSMIDVDNFKNINTILEELDYTTEDLMERVSNNSNNKIKSVFSRTQQLRYWTEVAKFKQSHHFFPVVKRCHWLNLATAVQFSNSGKVGKHYN